jgi:hypothetical protein
VPFDGKELIEVERLDNMEMIRCLDMIKIDAEGEVDIMEMIRCLDMIKIDAEGRGD